MRDRPVQLVLVAIDFVFTAIRLVFRGADFSEWLGEVVQQILYIGFFYALLTNSATWATAIVDSMRQAANQASAAGGGSINLSPADVFGIGVNIGQSVMGKVSIFTPGASAGLIIAGVVIVCCFAVIAAWMILALVESLPFYPGRRAVHGLRRPSADQGHRHHDHSLRPLGFGTRLFARCSCSSASASR